MERWILARYGWRWLTGLLLLLAFWLGARTLGTDPLWLDEIWTVNMARGADVVAMAPADIWTRNSAEDPYNVFGYHLAVAAWGSLVGWSAFALRVSSLLPGVLAVACTYRLASDMVSPRAGFAAAAVVASSAFFAYYLTELRGYIPAAALTMFTFMIYWRLTHAKRPGRMLWLAFLLGTIVMLYVHYSAIITLAGLGLYHLVFAPKNARWWRILLIMIGAGLLFLPWVGTLYALSGALKSDTFLQQRALTPLPMIAAVLNQFSNSVPVLLAIAVLGALFARGRGAGAAWFFALATLGLFAIANLIVKVIIPGRERYLLAMWPLLALLVGIGIDRIARTRLKLAAVPVLAIWIVVGVQASLDPAYARDIPGSTPLPWDRVAQYLQANATPGDRLIVHSPLPSWVLEIMTADYHLKGVPVEFSMLESLPDTINEEVRQFVQDFRAEAANVWIGVDQRSPSGPFLADFEHLLSEDYVACGRVLEIPRMTLDRYMRMPDDLAEIARFGDGIRLVHQDTMPPQAATLTTTLIWAVSPDTPPNTYSVALHVLGPDGELVAQQDYGLPADALACRKTDIPINGLSPGEYTLTVLVYNWQTGDRLPAVTSGGETVERVPLETFTVP